MLYLYSSTKFAAYKNASDMQILRKIKKKPTHNEKITTGLSGVTESTDGFSFELLFASF